MPKDLLLFETVESFGRGGKDPLRAGVGPKTPVQIQKGRSHFARSEWTPTAVL
jgi:hypothetical protein